jgi:hypothetical protein
MACEGPIEQLSIASGEIKEFNADAACEPLDIWLLVD